jgi:Concanavalin A-like lectin/glucanases superfamily/FG-GAP-like repeat/Putative Ig domain/Abnormal spindle-like microcephaly-assoc'd, ASPM-SPD-2-Hydin/Protein of unknown function (DUF1573)
LIAGDFNRDGVIDLAVANQSSNTISILLGKGDGTFATKTDFATGSAPIQLNAADLNGDGIFDLAVVNQSAGTVSILSGTGDGTFGSHVDYAAPGNVESLTVADLNGDGKLDLVTGSGGYFSVFFGNGDASFQSRRDFAAPFSHHPGVVAGDFNGDGRLDVALTDPETNKVSVFLQSPDAKVSSSSLAFGAQNVDTPSSAQSVTLTSTGSFPLHIVGVALTGTNFADFSETDNCVFSSPIAVGNACTISITFAPSAIGSRSASLQITDDASSNPQTVSLGGTGIAPLVSLSPVNLSFGNQGIATASAPKTVTLTNTGNASLSVANITASAGFSQTNNCPASLTPAANCTIDVIFNPTLIGAASGAVTITDNAVDSPQSVTLSGSSVTSIVAPVGLQSWWPGESNFNDIRGVNSGTSAGAVSFVPGEVGQAFHFDGTANSYFTVPNSATFAPASNQVTIAAWVRPNYTASNVVDTVFSKRDGCGFNRSYILDVTKAGLVSFGYPLGSIVWSASVAGDDAISTIPVPNDGLYHFIVGTYDGANMNVYLDGVLVGQKPHTGSIPITSDLPYVGKKSSCGDLAYADIDELQFYNRGLTLAEVSAIYNTANAGVSQNAPVPQINQPTAPVTATPGGAAFTLTVNGTGFVPSTTVNWNGSPRSTTFISSSQVTAAISASDIAAAGMATITAVNPAPGGGVSNSVFLAITNPAASLTFARSDVMVGSGPIAVAAADFNRDGHLDLAAVNHGSNSVSILLGNGDGTFQAHRDFTTGTAPTLLAIADFNGDGNPDLAIINESANTVSILLGNGDGTFGASTEYPVGPFPIMVVVGDFNRDGHLDLAVSNRDSNTVSILAGKGDGTFAPKVDYATAAGPLWLTAGDFNGDGVLDLAVVSHTTNAISVLLGNGDGTFQTHAEYPTIGTPYAVTTADVNGDGKLDLVTDSLTATTVLLGNGDGTFQLAVDYASGPGPTSIAMADLDGDGILDAVGSNLGANTISILRGNGDGSFKASTEYDAGAGPFGVAIGDFNGDGRLDVAVADFNTPQTIAILLQAPAVAISNTTLPFGNQNLGTTSTAQPVTITNSGSASLTISNIAKTGANPSDFAFTANPLPLSLAPGASTTLQVTFSPTVIGNRSASLSITDSATSSPQLVSLSGTGVGIAPAISSPNNTTFTVGTAGSFTVTASGAPTPTLSEAGTLPSGVTFNAATGALSGTLGTGTGGSYSIQFTASNGVGSNAVQNFTLTVRQAPAITSVASTTFTVGLAGSFTVTATGTPAPPLSESGAFPSGVTFNTATHILSGTPASATNGIYNITFTASNGVGANAVQNFLLTVKMPTVATVTLNPTTVPGGAANSVGTVTLNAPAVGTAAQRTVTLSSSNTAAATVPATVTVAAGATSANFTVTSQTVAAVSTANISATLNGGTQSTVLTVTPRAGVASLTLNSTTVLGGAANAVATVTLNAPAAGTAAQRTVTLSSSATSAASVPASVTVAAGATTATFTVTSHPVSAVTNAVITATLNGSATATLTVNPLVVTSVTLNPASVPGGAANSIGTVTLNAPAVGTAAQRTVTLSSSNTAAATVPATVTVAAGATSANFTVTSQTVAAVSTANISATLNGGTQSAVLTVTP